jgi:hypothetical protein
MGRSTIDIPRTRNFLGIVSSVSAIITLAGLDRPETLHRTAILPRRQFSAST